MGDQVAMKEKKFAPNMILIGIALGISFWLIDPLLNTFVLGHGKYWDKILNPSSIEIWIRAFVTFLFLVFGVFVERIESRRRKIEKALMESEERFRLLYEDAPLGYQSLDRDNMIIKVNKAWCYLLGYTENEVTGHNLSEFLTGKSKELFKRNSLRLLAMEEVHGQEFEMVKKNGEVIVVSFDGRMAKDIEGGFCQTHCIVHDITAQKRDEEALRRSENKFRQLAELLPETVFEADLDGDITFINQQAIRTYKYTEEDVQKGINIFQTIATEDRDRARANSAKMLAGNGGRSGDEYTLLKKDGTRFPAITYTSPIIQNDRIIGLRGIVVDITERKRAEQALRDREALLNSTLESTADGILVVDNNGRTVQCNNKFHQMWAIPSDIIEIKDDNKMLDFVLSQLVDPDYFLKKVRELYQSNDESFDALEFVDGRVFERYSCAFSKNDIIDGRVWSFRDVTKQRKAEEALRESETKVTGILTAAPICIGLAKNRIIIWINEFMCNLLGYSANELVGKNARILYESDEEFERVGNVKYGQIKETGIGEVETKWVKKTGEVLDIHLKSTCFSPDDPATGFIFTALDITERKRANEELSRLAMVIRHSGEMVNIATMDGMMTFLNDAGCKLLGIPPEKVNTINILQVIPQYLQEMVKSELLPCLMRGETWQGDMKIQNLATGELKDVHMMTFALNDPHTGKPQYLANVSHDITKKKKTQQALIESEAKYKILFETSTDALFLMTDVFLDCNDQACKLWACERSDIITHSPIEFSPEFQPDGRRSDESATDKINAALAGTPQFFYWKHKQKDGLLIDTEVSLKSIKLGQQTIIIATVRDISERIKAQEMIAAEKEQLAVTLKCIGDGVITTDINGQVALLNEVAEHLTGWKNADAFARPLEDIFLIIDERSRAKKDNPIAHVLDQKIPIEMDGNVVLISRNGDEYIIADSAAPIKNTHGETIGVVIVFRDITEKRKIEEELAKAGKIESLGILAGGIAHDFNNILTAIVGNISLAKMSIGENTEVSRILTDAEKASARAQDLTYQLLTFAKGGAPVKRTADIAQIIRETVGFALRGSKTRCEFRLPEELYPVEFDEGQISQVINNLIINADQAMPQGGVISIIGQNISAEQINHPIIKQGKWVKTSIKDTGVGIPDQYLGKVFDPFFTTKQKGSGLGLAISYSIVKRHDGYIDVESTPGVGTTFHLYFPASEAKIAETAKDSERLTPGAGKIIIMDDDEGILTAASMALTKLGYQVGVARDGGSAIELYQAAMNTPKPFDALIMDLTVPGGLGGKETIAILRQIDPNIKAIVSSGYSNDPIMSEYAKYGFSGMICKPYKAQQLGRVLQDVLSKPKSLVPVK
jgi:PAS domain S-box-containing protein